MITQNSKVYITPYIIVFLHYTRIWKKISVGGIVYFTVLCDHPYLVSILFAVLVSLLPVTFLNVFDYLSSYHLYSTMAKYSNHKYVMHTSSRQFIPHLPIDQKHLTEQSFTGFLNGMNVIM